MGLMNFLKNKFSKKQEEDINQNKVLNQEDKKTVEDENSTSPILDEEIKQEDENSTSIEPKIDEIKNTNTKIEEDKQSKETDKVVENTTKSNKEDNVEIKTPLSTYQKQEIGIQNKDEQTRAYV